MNMENIAVSDEVYQLIEENRGTQTVEEFTALMLRSGVHHWKKVIESLPEEF